MEDCEDGVMITNECELCGGSGEVQVCIGIDYVSRDMATDAGEPAMEGMPMEQFDWERCPECAEPNNQNQSGKGKGE